MVSVVRFAHVTYSTMVTVATTQSGTNHLTRTNLVQGVGLDGVRPTRVQSWHWVPSGVRRATTLRVFDDPVTVTVQFGSRQYYALVDTGAASSILSNSVVNDLVSDGLCSRLPTRQRFKLADRSGVSASVKLRLLLLSCDLLNTVFPL